MISLQQTTIWMEISQELMMSESSMLWKVSHPRINSQKFISGIYSSTPSHQLLELNGVQLLHQRKHQRRKLLKRKHQRRKNQRKLLMMMLISLEMMMSILKLKRKLRLWLNKRNKKLWPRRTNLSQLPRLLWSLKLRSMKPQIKLY